MDFWQETLAQATAFRRQLHSFPELTWEEHNTAISIRKLLSEMGISWRECAGTGTVAWLGEGKPGCKQIALRADIDALPINEQSGQEWSSTHQGCMHACGHDGHAAALIATARWLKKIEHELNHRVVLLFQPAEEGGHGAKAMIEGGALEGVDEIYGWHNWPAIPLGKLVCPDQLIMCGNGTFEIVVEGQGGHASQPELCHDPVLAASAITQALQQIVSRRVAPQDTAVVSVTSIEASSGLTVIPQQAVISGSIRVSNERIRALVNKAIEEISTYIGQGYGVTSKVKIDPRYSPTINHPAQAQHVRQQWTGLYGEEAIDTELMLPVMASEDFSYYLNEVPGAFALIGSDDGQRQHQVPCHSPFYDFNDALLPKVVSLYSQLVGASVPR